MGLVNFYRDMWKNRSHLLSPLAALTSKKRRWKWSDECEKAFEGIKAIIARDVMLSYPCFSKEFIIHTDASDVQLGGVITQDNKPLAFFSRKLSEAQRSYTVTERELLSIVELLKEYRNMLLGQKIVIYTDHLNLLNVNTTSIERVQRWRLLLEEYGVEIRYIKGDNNIVADSLSRMKINKVSRKELKHRKALKYLNAMTINSPKFSASFKENKIKRATRANDTFLNHIFQNHINDVRKKARRTNRRKKRTKSPREPANVASLLSFPIEWAQLEDKQRRNTEILRKARLQESNWSLQPVLEGRHELIMKNNKFYIPEEHANDVIQ